MLRSEIFVSEDGQLLVADLVLDYEPLSHIFQDASQALRVGNPRFARIDVSKPGFLAQRDLPPVQLPIQHLPQEVAVLRDEIASVQLSLKAKIDQFCLEDKEGVARRPVELLDSTTESDRLSAAHTPKLIVANVGTNSEEEKEDMDLKQNTGLRVLMANRNKGSTLKEVPKIQVPASPSLPSP